MYSYYYQFEKLLLINYNLKYINESDSNTTSDWLSFILFIVQIIADDDEVDDTWNNEILCKLWMEWVQIVQRPFTKQFNWFGK